MAAFDGSADRYDWFERKWHFYHDVADLIVRRLDPSGGGAILDLACGTGASTACVSERWPDATVVGVDASRDMLACARSKANRAGRLQWVFLQVDASRLPFRPESFSGAICSAAFWQMRRPAEILRSLRSVLAPGASFGISLPVQRLSPTFADGIVRKAGELVGERPWLEARSSTPRGEDPSSLLREAGFEPEVDELEQICVPEPLRLDWNTIPTFALQGAGLSFVSNAPLEEVISIRNCITSWSYENFPEEIGISTWRILIARAGPS